nr:putative late blight resistance protein homolog R1B-14 [Ipomoea batatas]
MTIILDKVAEEAVTRAVNKLVQTVADNLKLVSGIESDIIHLTSDIETFNARLMDASMNPRANEFELLDVVLKKFRFVTDEAQDVITEYITLKKKHEDNVLAKLLDKNPLPFCGFCGLCGKVKGYASKIQLVRTMVNTIRQDHEVDLRCLTNYQNHDDHTHLQDVPMVEGDCVVGFDSDLKTIKDRLIAAPNGFIVIPIVGIPGCGKTTFAKMVFEDSVIRDEFIHCIWVNASRGFNRKQKFIDILNQITDEHTANFSDMSEDALGQKISDFLTYKKYFIVVDNVWSVEEWKSLKIAFPNNLEGSRVLLTTRYDSVAGYIGGPYILQDLSAEDEKSDLITILPRRLCFHSSIVADSFVARKNPFYMFFFSCCNTKKSSRLSSKRVHSLLLSSSNKTEIPLTTEKQLERRDSYLTENQLTEKQLEDRVIGLTENHLAAISNSFPHLMVLDIEAIKFELLPEEIYGLYHLRYLAVSTDLSALPKQFGNLHSLETLVLKTTQSELAIGEAIWKMEKLRHMHTNTSAKLLSPPGTSKNSFGSTDIQPLASSTEKLRHVLTDTFAKLLGLPRTSKSSFQSTKIHTLSTISPASCTEEIFSKTPHLQKLGVRGDLASLLKKNQQGMCLFDNLQKLDYLENLKLHGQSRSQKILKVPTLEKFPRKLRKLTLSNTLFVWSDIVILGSLEELEVLKLDKNAFRGNTWNWYLPEDVVFNQLQYLRIGNTNLVIWNFTQKDKFPNLERLVLRNCTKLKQIPSAFGDVSSLKVMELFHVSDDAYHSARSLHQETNKRFELLITSLTLQEKDTVKEPIVADFDNEVGIIKKRLTGGSKNLAIIPIVGKRGIGKTRLAAMIFKEPELEYKFFIRLWVDVSESYSRKKIFLNILSMLITDQVEEYDDMIEEELVKKIEKLLYGGKYLIVIDDLRKEHDWEGLKKVFPDNMNGSRILITTRNSQVASDADFDLASDADSDLGSDADSDLKPVKLEGEAASNEDGELAETAQLNYHKLDSKMKDCFQYFAAFPEELVIDARKLMHMWIAEGLVETSEEEPGLVETSEEEPGLVETSEEEPGLVETSEEEPEPEPEHTAETYLNALVENHLLIASKRRADGGIKTVSIHYLLLDFCRNEAANQNLFRTLEGRLGGVSNGYRRLSVHSSLLQQDTSEIINAVTPRENVQSFLSFSSDATQIPEAVMVMAAIPNAFPNLKEFRNLRQLQVLIFHTTQSALKIEADIWNMPNLRHLHTNTPAKLPNPTRRCRFRSSSGTGSACITTLSTISPTSCRKKILDKATNLRKLRIRGNLGELMETRKGGISLFDNLKQLSHLQNLKLLNSAIPGQAASRLQSIPQHDKFPQKLRKLTLSNTSLEWENMYVLGKLEELEVLKLEEYAFRGEFWEIDENFVFKALRFLRIGRTDLVEWVAYPSSFPVLETLAIRHCTRLEALPPKLDSMYNLKLLELYCTTKMAAISAREIKRRLDDLGDEEFNLSIYPPNH